MSEGGYQSSLMWILLTLPRWIRGGGRTLIHHKWRICRFCLKPILIKVQLFWPGGQHSQLFFFYSVIHNAYFSIVKHNPERAYFSLCQPITAYYSILKHSASYSSLFKNIPAYSILFQPIPTYSSLFQSNPAYFSLFNHIPAYSSQLQPTPPYSRLFQCMPLYSSLF